MTNPALHPNFIRLCALHFQTSLSGLQRITSCQLSVLYSPVSHPGAVLILRHRSANLVLCVQSASGRSPYSMSASHTRFNFRPLQLLEATGTGFVEQEEDRRSESPYYEGSDRNSTPMENLMLESLSGGMSLPVRALRKFETMD